MRSVMSPVGGLAGSNVLFSNFLDCFVHVHRLKPRDNGFLKLKVFAALFDADGKGKLSKNDLKQSVYYACLDSVL